MNFYVKFEDGTKFINIAPKTPKDNFIYINEDGETERHSKSFSEYLIWATTTSSIVECFYTKAETIPELHLLHPEVLI